MIANHNTTYDLVTNYCSDNEYKYKEHYLFYVLKYLDIQRGIPKKFCVIQMCPIWEISNSIKLRVSVT